MEANSVRAAFAAVLLALMTMIPVSAHEGHKHTIMGTIASVQSSRIEIKATTGKTASVVLDDKTHILRGTARVKAADLKVGERVVATAIETKDKKMVAQDVRVAGAPMKH
jgi:hypothetical protein